MLAAAEAEAEAAKAGTDPAAFDATAKVEEYIRDGNFSYIKNDKGKVDMVYSKKEQ